MASKIILTLLIVAIVAIAAATPFTPSEGKGQWNFNKDPLL